MKTTETGGQHGSDGGKKINGRKRHIFVDTLGLLLAAAIASAAMVHLGATDLMLRRLAKPAVQDPPLCHRQAA